MLKKFTGLLWEIQDFYFTYKKEIKLASNIKIKNKLLAQELEEECKKRYGILTYPEFLAIEQFGKNGFYTTSKSHGKTDVDKRWSKALVNYCKQFGYDTIIEFGCGTGELGIATAKVYKEKYHTNLKWIGVEIDTRIHMKIYDKFQEQSVQDAIEKIAASIDEIPKQKNALLLFPYSLDNIPPHIFLTTKQTTSSPDALLGITVKDGLLSEVIIPQAILQKKKMKLKDGLFVQDTYKCNLISWKLRKGQRAFIPIDSFITIYDYVKKFDNKTTVILIDEFREEPWFFDLRNLGIPKSLYEHNLVCNDKKRYYRESGKHNFYYPQYTSTLLHFLNSIGFQLIDYDVEQKMSAQLSGKRWIPTREHYSTLSFIARNFVERKIDALPISFIPKRIF